MSTKTQYNLNLAIEEFIKNKDAAGADYSREDVKYINQFAGYGGMAKFGAEGKGLLSEYFTPYEVCEKMMGLATKHGYAGGPVLEPAVGVGRFLHYVLPDEEVDAYEINPVSARIAEINYPHFNIHQQYFNQVFVDHIGRAKPFKPKYRLVIGNPPYGVFEGRHTTTEKRATKAKTYVEYFITRGLDLLLKDGLLTYIIPTTFLDGGSSEAKTDIERKADLLTSYRLPNGIFDATDVGTDIVVFKRK